MHDRTSYCEEKEIWHSSKTLHNWWMPAFNGRLAACNISIKPPIKSLSSQTEEGRQGKRERREEGEEGKRDGRERKRKEREGRRGKE